MKFSEDKDEGVHTGEKTSCSVPWIADLVDILPKCVIGD